MYRLEYLLLFFQLFRVSWIQRTEGHSEFLSSAFFLIFLLGRKRLECFVVAFQFEEPGVQMHKGIPHDPI